MTALPTQPLATPTASPADVPFRLTLVDAPNGQVPPPADGPFDAPLDSASLSDEQLIDAIRAEHDEAERHFTAGVAVLPENGATA